MQKQCGLKIIIQVERPENCGDSLAHMLQVRVIQRFGTMTKFEGVHFDLYKARVKITGQKSNYTFLRLST